MANPAFQLPSFEDLYREIERLPEGVTGQILEPGVLHTMSRPGKPHRHVAKRCFQTLQGFDVSSGGTGWWVEIEAEIRFPGGRLVVPDLAGWRVERVPELPNENPLTVLPDWCCEVLSPSTARDDKRLKLPLYSECAVPWSWLIDPELRLVEVYETVGKRPALTITAKDDDQVVLLPFESAISLQDWWL